MIKPQKKPQATVNIVKPEMIIESELVALHQLDDKVDWLHKKLNLTAKLRPTNYLNELDNFITRKGNYSPVFSYNFPDLRKMSQWKDELSQLREECGSKALKSPLVRLFSEKVEELVIRHQLLEAYVQQDIARIDEGNRLLWGDFDEELVKLSREKIGEMEDKEVLGELVGFREVKEKLEKRMNELDIFGVNIVENSSNLSYMSLSMGQETRINIGQGAGLREMKADAIIAHEVDTHLLRYMNGKKS